MDHCIWMSCHSDSYEVLLSYVCLITLLSYLINKKKTDVMQTQFFNHYSNQSLNKLIVLQS